MEKLEFTLAEIDNVSEWLLSRAATFHGGEVKLSQMATTVALSGDLGSGKTTLIQAVGRLFDIKAVIQSPTFVLIRSYEIPVGKWPWRKLIHIDCYRLNSDQDLLKLGWPELIADAHNLIMLEWPERVEGILPLNTLNLKLEIFSDGKRMVSTRATTHR